MKLPLLPQQSLMLEHMMNVPEAAVFASPGLGKTRAVLEFAEDWISDGGKGILVLAPLRVARLTWPAEIQRWTPNLRIADLRTEEGRKKWEKGTADIYLCNIEYIQQLVEACMEHQEDLPADVLVIDELSRLKEPGGKRFKVLLKHRNRFKRHIGLTGTPGSHMELFGQIKILDGGKRLGRFITHYKQEFFWADYMGYTFTLKEGAAEEIEYRIKDMVITLKAEEYMDIPPVGVNDIEVALPDNVQREYKILQKKFLLEFEGNEIMAPTAAVKVSKLQQITGGSVYGTDPNGKRVNIAIHDVKIAALKQLHSKMQQAPLLVFTQFVHERERILRAIPYAEDFSEGRLADWNAGNIKMFVADARSISLGLNMQGSCCNVCWYSLTYSSTDYQQANARVARTGQTQPVTIHRILASNTVDWAIAESLRNKLDGEGSLMAALSALRMLEK